MKREIKFRAWDKTIRRFYYRDFPDGKRWVAEAFEPILITLDGLVFIREDERLKERTRNFTLQQFTGLKDKAGAEIYEGDIMVIEIGEDYMNAGKYVVEVIHQGGGFRLDNNFNNYLVGDRMSLYPSIEDGYVVGNVFENPELIGKVNT